MSVSFAVLNQKTKPQKGLSDRDGGGNPGKRGEGSRSSGLFKIPKIYLAWGELRSPPVPARSERSH